MDPSITATVVQALPDPHGAASAFTVDLVELRDELEGVASDALDARMRGIALSDAARDDQFPRLKAFHSALRDSLLVEIPKELQPWVVSMSEPANVSGSVGQNLGGLHEELFAQAYGQDLSDMDERRAQLRTALAEVLLFESVRLRLLVEAWSSTDFESLGGDEPAIDEIAWHEVELMLNEPALLDPEVRAVPVMVAAGAVALAQDAAARAEALRLVGEEQREELRMRARLRSALRELRLPESVLLENALANLLGEERTELPELQDAHPMALEGLSRQAMDQRVSRGRRALINGPEKWPSRRRPALFDLLRSAPNQV